MLDLASVRGFREPILELASRYGVRKVRLFGSVVRGAATDQSDLYVLADFEPKRRLLDQIGFEQDLEELLGCRVEVVAEGGVSPYLEERIEREAVPL